MKLFVDFCSDAPVINSTKPRFSWQVPLEGRNRRQTAYHLLVASTPDLLTPGAADLWDTGKVESRQSVNIPYEGDSLKSNGDYFWKVLLWDEQDEQIASRANGIFSTPLLDPDDWQASWVGMGSPDEPWSDPAAFQKGGPSDEIKAIEPDPRSPMMRREFTIDRAVKRARAYICGVGFHELHLNGEKVGSDVISTPRTDYRQRVIYNTYDISGMLADGSNAIGVMLGNSWFNGQKKYWGWQHQWYGSPRVIVQVMIDFEDGTSELVVSDGSWQGDWSPITSSCVYDGETYDARLEQPGWNQPGFDDGKWASVNVVASPGGVLTPQAHESEAITEIVKPVSIKEPESGVYVVDLGKNMTGWVRLKIRDGQRGSAVKLHYGEAQYEDGSLNSSSNNAACQEDTYIMKGDAEEVYEPRFTFHGFQFVEVKGMPSKLELDDIEGCFVRTSVEQTGSFECASDLITTIHRCTLQSQLCNVQLGVPTDDTQRPERLGWGADAWATANEALYNLWMPRVYEKWIGDFRDQQDDESGFVGMITPQAGASEDLVWTTAFIMVPWLTYLHSGDTRILEENYPNFQRYMSYLKRCGVKSVDTITTEEALKSLLWNCAPYDRYPNDEDRGHLQISQWGDHLCTNEGFLTRSNQPISVATAFYYYDVATMAQIAETIGRTDDAADYRSLAEDIKRAFNDCFYDQKTGYYDTGVQSAQAWPLVFGLVPEEQVERLRNYYITMVGDKQRRLTTGYVSTKFAIQALAEAGRNDLVWKLATATTYPSWGYMLSHNRTTTCEQWNGERGSLNHAPLGAAIDEWFYWGLAGIKPDPAQPGYANIVIEPFIPVDLDWAKASLQTMRGIVSSSWSKQGNSVILDITIPANSSATVVLPTGQPDTITESGNALVSAEGVDVTRTEEASIRLKVGSGNYSFSFISQPASL